MGIKFFNTEPVDAPLIEHASMSLAARAGITVAQTQVVPLLGVHAVAIQRLVDAANGLFARAGCQTRTQEVPPSPIQIAENNWDLTPINLTPFYSAIRPFKDGLPTQC